MSPNTTNTIHADAPVSINDHDNDRSSTNCPRTSAAATRFAKSRTVSLNAARCPGSNRSIVVTQPGTVAKRVPPFLLVFPLACRVRMDVSAAPGRRLGGKFPRRMFLALLPLDASRS